MRSYKTFRMSLSKGVFLHFAMLMLMLLPCLCPILAVPSPPTSPSHSLISKPVVCVAAMPGLTSSTSSERGHKTLSSPLTKLEASLFLKALKNIVKSPNSLQEMLNQGLVNVPVRFFLDKKALSRYPYSNGSKFGPWTIAKQLHANVFGFVLHGFRQGKKGIQDVALKFILKSRVSDTLVLSEIRIHNEAAFGASKATYDPNVIGLYGVWEFSDAYVLSLEYGSRGDFFDFLKNMNGPTPELLLKDLFIPLLFSIAALHSKGIAHRDLKPENLLVFKNPITSEDQLKISDFGLSSFMDDRSPLRIRFQCCGTPGYSAPEVLSSEERFNAEDVELKARDAYSFGATLFVATFKHLVGGEHGNLSITFDGRNDISDILLDLMKRFLNPDLKYRLTIEEALMHPWITGKGGKPDAQLRWGPIPNEWPATTFSNIRT